MKLFCRLFQLEALQMMKAAMVKQNQAKIQAAVQSQQQVSSGVSPVQTAPLPAAIQQQVAEL